jgi:hypothetical protein
MRCLLVGSKFFDKNYQVLTFSFGGLARPGSI